MDYFVRLPRPVVAILAATSLLTLTGCGAAADATDARPSVLDSRAPESTSSPKGQADQSSPSPTSTTGAAAAVTAPDAGSAAGRQQFARGMADYCTRFYADQRSADEQYPGGDPQSLLSYAAANVDALAEQEQILVDLTPPPELNRTFAEFMAVVQYVHDARVALTRAGSAAEYESATAHFQTVLAKRYPMAKALHAARCDGELLPKERAAVVALTKTFDLTVDPKKGCVTLVTPEYVTGQWVDQADPMAACTADRTKRQGHPRLVARDIKVSKVTGVDGLTATVYFTEVGGCCAGQPTVARLYHFPDGTWKVRAMSYE